MFSRCSGSDKKELRRNKIGDEEADITMFHRSPYARTAQSMPMALEGKQLRNSVKHRGVRKISKPNRFMANVVLCDPPERLGLPLRFWVTGRELRLFNCAENRLGIVRLGRY